MSQRSFSRRRVVDPGRNTTGKKPAGRKMNLIPRLCSLLAGGVMLAGGVLPGLNAEPAWHPKQAPLMTPWAASVNPTNVWSEYPRPQLVRPDWENLNGLWDYAITRDTVEKLPPFAGKILVPFPVESALSGVMTNFDENSK